MNLITKILIIMLLSCAVIAADAAQDDFEIVKDRVVAELMKYPVEDGRVKAIIGKMNKDGSFRGINYADLSRIGGFPQEEHTSNLVYLARAYKSKNSKFYNTGSLREVITLGYQYWIDNDFFGDNWHNNQITTPGNLVDLMLLIGDELPEALVRKGQPIIGRASMNASGARPSGDKIVIAGILAKNLLFIGDREQFAKIIELIEGELKFSTGSRGMQHDFSFHHRTDRVNNTTSYGYTKYANTFGEWSCYVAKTKYAFSIEKINLLVDYYLNGIFKQQVYAIYPDVSVKNRSISRRALFQPRPTLEIERLIQSTDYRKDELEKVIQLRNGRSIPPESFAKFFWQSEHFVFQRPNFYTTVRMYSTRNRNMEMPYNGEGTVTHHRADGSNYLMLKGDEYQDIWPVCNWQKIPGTTVVQKPRLYPPDEIQKEGLTDFVGAVTDGLYGAVAFDFISPHDFVKAKKAWFFFDHEYVCLGAGISSERNMPVATTINQVLLKGDVTISQDDNVAVLTEGDRQLKNVKWVHQDKVGYLFPQPVSVNVLNQTQQGRWSDINYQKIVSKEIVNKKVFMMWFDHGDKPINASYCYIVVPDVAVSELSETSGSNRDIEILKNDPQMQAVRHTKLGISQLIFYKAGQIDITSGMKIKMADPGVVMVKMKDDRIKELSVSDPSRKLSKVEITVSGIYSLSGDGYSAVPNKTMNNSLITVNLPQGVFQGKSVTIQL